MSDAHDNTVPAKRGTYNLSKAGIVCYFPIEDAGFMKPFLALILIQNANGDISATIDQIWMPLKGMDTSE